MPINLDRLRKTLRLHSLTEEQMRTVGSLMIYRQFPVSMVVCTENTDGDSMFFIESGAVDFYTHDAEGKEKSFRTLREGAFFGEVALLTGELRSVNAKVTEECFAWELHRDNFAAFLKAAPGTEMVIMKEMAHRLATSAELIHDTATPSIATEIAVSRSDLEKLVQSAVQSTGTLWFLALNVILFAVWVVVNKVLLRNPWDSREFGFLSLFAALEALLLTILVLAKQNRDEQDDDIRANRILKNTHTAEQEIAHLRKNMAVLAGRLNTAQIEKPISPEHGNR